MALTAVAYTLGTLILVVNVMFSLVGIKTFSKKTHSFLVLCLSVSDGLHGIAVLSFTEPIFGKPNLDVSLDINIPMCILRLIIYFASVALSLTILLFISVERYLTVKHFNFISSSFSLRKKLAIIGLLIGVVFLYLCIWIASAPFQRANVKVCSIHSLYTDHVLDISSWGIISLYLFLVLTNLVLYGRTTFILWRTFRKTVVQSEKQRVNRNSLKTNTRIFDFSQPSTSTEAFSHPSIGHSLKISRWKIVKDHLIMNVGPNTVKGNLSGMSNKTKINGPFPQAITELNGTRERKISSLLNPFENRAAIVIPWEKRAMVTNCFLILDLVIFFLPMISLLIVESVHVNIPQEILMVGMLWLMLHFLINPFIFSWRIKEIHDEIKKILRCNNNNNNKVIPVLPRRLPSDQS